VQWSLTHPRWHVRLLICRPAHAPKGLVHATQAITLWTGNHVYLYLSVAFIQMFKAFTPVITMACLVVAGLERPNGSMVAAVLITAAGTALAAYGELNLSFIGLALNVASGVSESVRLVMTQARGAECRAPCEEKLGGQVGTGALATAVVQTGVFSPTAVVQQKCTVQAAPVCWC
jgi:drug/metabolite transporter (DMT)-like permease